MRHPARISFVATLAALALTAACSDSSGPSVADQATQVAVRFDSIYVDATARSNSGANAYASRALLASLLEIPAAFGTVPSTISVTTAGGMESWRGYEFLNLSSAGAADSTFVLLAFRESNAHTALVIFFDASGVPQVGGMITGDTLSVLPDSANAATSLHAVGAACRAVPASLTNPEFNAPLASTCALATFTTSLSLHFAATSGLESALTNLSFASATINGIRVVAPVDTTTARKVGTLKRMFQRGNTL